MGRTRASGVRDWDQVTVRLPPGMRDKINELAAQHGRSANAEIVARLQASMKPADCASSEVVRQIVREELRAVFPEGSK